MTTKKTKKATKGLRKAKKLGSVKPLQKRSDGSGGGNVAS
jgi:hypothetical protein